MEYILEEDAKQEGLNGLSMFSDSVDEEFWPYLNRINALPYVVTWNSCAGHIPYGLTSVSRVEKPANHTDAFGYLQIVLPSQLAWAICQHLHGNLANYPWLWVKASQLFGPDGTSWDCLPPEGLLMDSTKLAFSWDASQWPKPAEDICDLLERLPKIAAELEPLPEKRFIKRKTNAKRAKRHSGPNRQRQVQSRVRKRK